MLLHKCVSVCTQAWARGRRVCERQIVRETDRLWWLWCVLWARPSEKEERKKRQHYRTNASLQTTSLQECVWLPRQVKASHTHSCVQMSISKGDDVQELFSLQRPQARPRSDTPARKSKTALHPNSAGFSFAALFLLYGSLISFVFETVSFRYISLQPGVSIMRRWLSCNHTIAFVIKNTYI